MTNSLVNVAQTANNVAFKSSSTAIAFTNMYIEYTTPQRPANPEITEYNSKGGEYRPTWLIRTSDWEKVPGTEATDGYHTLSYCWEQSGEKFQQENGEYILIDDSHHRVTTKFLEKRKNRRSTRYRRPTRTKYVSYNDLLQQICKDFGIDYLWYDKICIDQTNKEEKKREIKQMHLIYSNARYTVALVPEINVDNFENFYQVNWHTGDFEAKTEAIYQMYNSLWWKRSWTLEELMMSTRILILGRNTHFWSLADFKQGDKIKENDGLANMMLGFTERRLKSANQVLRHAHFRTSTKAHDKIYALANIFHDMVDIDVDYGIDVSIAMNSFYRKLAQKDLSVMCFGSNMLPRGVPQDESTMDSYGLASWTGVSGFHANISVYDTTLDKNCDYTIDDNMRLHIKCRSYSIRPNKYNKHNYDVYEDDERGKKAFENYDKVITSMDDFDGDENEALDWSQWCMLRIIVGFATHYYKPDDHDSFLSPILPLSLTEECDECVILGVVFDCVAKETPTDNVLVVGYDHFYLLPVARKSTDGSSHKIIGVVLLQRFQYNEPRPTPQEAMDKMFNGLGCDTRDFCIE